MSLGRFSGRRVVSVGLCTVFLVCLAEPVGLARMATAPSAWYVGPSGANTNDCQSAATACLTIGAGIAKAAPGDTLFIASGSYNENVVIPKDLTITGAGVGATIIAGSTQDSLVRVYTSTTVSISGVSVQHAGGLPGPLASFGGGIVNWGALSLSNSAVSGNITTSGDGNGLYNAGTLLLVNDTVSGNNSNTTLNAGSGMANHGALTMAGTTVSNNNGGGVANDGTLTMTDSTIYYNGAVSFMATYPSIGGGVFNRGNLTVTGSTIDYNGAVCGGAGIENSGMITLTNSTISGNTLSNATCYTATSGAGIHGNGVGVLANATISGNGFPNAPTLSGGGIAGGSYRLKNTILGGNGASSSADCYNSVLTSQGYNLIGDSNCTLLGDATGVITGRNPLLENLNWNGGPTMTMAVLPGSPVIDAGDPAGCADASGAALLTDQRGYARVFPPGGRCDMGAYEYASFPYTPPTTTPTSSATASPTPSATPSATPVATYTPVPPPTNTAYPTATSYPTYTPQPTNTAYPTSTPQPTATPVACSRAYTYTFQSGWNSLTLPLVPSPPLYARDLLASVQGASGGRMAELAVWSGGRWVAALDMAGRFYGPNYALTIGAGYLLYTDKPASYTLHGCRPIGPIVSSARRITGANLSALRTAHGAPALPGLALSGGGGVSPRASGQMARPR